MSKNADNKAAADGSKASTSDKHSKSEGNSTSHKSSNAVGHYILGKALGEGTFGKVKLGTHILSGEKVAVKVLEKSKIKDKKDVERISREIKILKQLHHPNVVQIYEIIETEKDLFLVMEYASGGELFDLIVQNQRLKERTASKYFQELVAGVHYFHKLGICHRDLKPENLLIDFDKSLKIVDFGLSNTYEKGQTLKTACGSPCYAAPEMIAGNRYHGLKSDLWSCGVVLYAMLCGYLPFEDQKTSNLYKKILSADYSLPKFLSSDAKDFLGRIFETDPEKRIDIDGIRAHPWYKLHQPENTHFNHHNQKVRVSSKVVQKLEAQLGFNKDSIEKSVINNKHNHLSATYYLIYKKCATQAYKTAALNPPSNQLKVTSAKHDEKTKDTSSKRRTASAGHAGRNVDDSRDVTSPTIDVKKESSGTKNNTKSRSPSKGKPPAAIQTSTNFDRTTPATSTNTAPAASSHYNPHRQVPTTDFVTASRDIRVAPIEDQLALKGHRREQSANATSSRPNKHSSGNAWGEDERRTESYHRPAQVDDYEVVISKPTPQPVSSKSRQSNTTPVTAEASASRKNNSSSGQHSQPRPQSASHATKARESNSSAPPTSSHSANNSSTYQQRRKSSSHNQTTTVQSNSSKQRSSSAAPSKSHNQTQQIDSKRQAQEKEKNHVKLQSTQLTSKDKHRKTHSVVQNGGPDELNKYFYNNEAKNKVTQHDTVQEAIFKNVQSSGPQNLNQTQGKVQTGNSVNTMLMSDLQHMLSQKSYFDSIVSSGNNRAQTAADAAIAIQQQNKDLLVNSQIAAGTVQQQNHRPATTGLNLSQNLQVQPRATSVNIVNNLNSMNTTQPAPATMVSLHDTISTQQSKANNYASSKPARGDQKDNSLNNSVIMIRDGQYHQYSGSQTRNSSNQNNYSSQQVSSKHTKAKSRTNATFHGSGPTPGSTTSGGDFIQTSLDYNTQDLMRMKQSQNNTGGISPSSLVPQSKQVFYGTIPISSNDTVAPGSVTAKQANTTTSANYSGQSKQISSNSGHHRQNTTTSTSKQLSQTQKYAPSSKHNSQGYPAKAYSLKGGSNLRSSSTTKHTNQASISSQGGGRGRSQDARQSGSSVSGHMGHTATSSGNQRSHSTTAGPQSNHHGERSRADDQVRQSANHPQGVSNLLNHKSNSMAAAQGIYDRDRKSGQRESSSGTHKASTRIDSGTSKEQSRKRAQSCSYSHNQHGSTQQVGKTSQTSDQSRQRVRSQTQSRTPNSNSGGASHSQQQQLFNQTQIEREHTKALLMRSLDMTMQHQASNSGKRTSAAKNMQTTTSASRSTKQGATSTSMSEQDINRFYKQLLAAKQSSGGQNSAVLTEDQQLSAKLLQQAAKGTRTNGYPQNASSTTQVDNYLMSVPTSYYQQTRKERDEVMTQYLLNQTLSNQPQPSNSAQATRASQVVAVSNKIVQQAAGNAQTAFQRKVAALDHSQQQSLLNNTTVHQAAAKQTGPPLTLHTNFFHPSQGNSLASTEQMTTFQPHGGDKQSMKGREKAVAATDLGIDMKAALLSQGNSSKGKFNQTQGIYQGSGRNDDQYEYYAKLQQQMSNGNRQEPSSGNRSFGVVPQPVAQLNATLINSNPQQPGKPGFSINTGYYDGHERQNSISPSNIVAMKQQQNYNQQYYTSQTSNQSENRMSFTRFCN